MRVRVMVAAGGGRQGRYRVTIRRQQDLLREYASGTTLGISSVTVL